jgi:hypothetical protein
MKNGKRDYKRENKEYNSKPEVIKKRVQRNKARQDAIKDGKAKVGDGTSVDHIKPLSKGGSNSKSNLRVVKAEENYSFRRNSKSQLVSQTSKREARKGGRKK